MASLLDGILGQLGGGAVENLSRQLGTDPNQTKSGIAAALPVLLGALSRNTQSSGGASALSAALDRDHDGSILDDVAGFFAKGETSTGAGILKHVLGAKQSRVETGLSKSTGMNGQAAGQLLAMLAPMVLGALGKAKREKQMGATDLAGLLGQERQTLEQRAPRQMNVMNSLLDADGDGDVDFDDIAKQGGGLLGKLFG